VKERRAVFSSLALAAALLVCACSHETGEAPETQRLSETSAVTVAETEETKVPDVISPLAKEALMLPLSEHSWEREYPAEYVVIHFSSNVVNDRDDPFVVEAVRDVFASTDVSVHYMIDRDGTVYCFIPENYAAWHAGKGEFAGDERLTDKMNKYSIGIELLAIGSATDMEQYLTPAEYAALDPELIGFTGEQYDALSALLEDVCARNSIPFDRNHVIGHNEYNPDKSDPGELFDWERVIK
jgi:N-acetylmuramoyl-L-alanine amidase